MDAISLKQELGVLRQLVSRAEAETRRTRWRLAMQRRSTRVARVLRLAPRVVRGQTVTTRKRDAGWEVIADGTVALTVHTRTAARSIGDLEAPFLVHVHHPELLQPDAIDALVLDGTITVPEPP